MFFRIEGILFLVAGLAALVIAIVKGGSIVLGFGIMGITFVIVGAVLVWYGGSGQRAAKLAATGLVGTATIISVRDTGVTVNQNPRVALQLQVALPGREPYTIEHKSTVSRLLTGRLAPGATFACAVDPNRPDKMVIDWQSPIGAGSLGVAGSPTPHTVSEMPAGQVGSAKELLATGQPGRARVAQTFETAIVTDDGDPVVGFVLDVTPADGRAPFQARIGHRVPKAMLARTVPGTSLSVRYDPDHPSQKVAIDWDAP